MSPKNLQEVSSQTSEICKFYAGKTIFITGAAGFLGTVLLEILLRCCPDICRIYILLRSKKGLEPEERKNLIFKKDIFIQIKETNPDVLKKVTAVNGDVSKENLGLSNDDFKNLTKDVSIVFHIAANVSFLKPLGYVVLHNVIGTSNIIDFCRKSEKLEALVYTSSVFSSSNHKDVMEEKIYDLPFSTEEVIKIGKYGNEDEIMRLYHMCKPPFANFYTFSKCVTENLLKDEAYDLPICIIRPSIIYTCLKGPLPGYIEGTTAIVNFPVGVGKGFIRVLRIDDNKKIEIIPADIVANSHIVGAFLQASKRLPSPSVCNCAAGELVVIKWGEYISSLLKMTRKRALPQVFLYQFCVTCKNAIPYNILSLLLHYMPAAVFDLLLWISGSQLRLLKKYKFFDKAMNSVAFVTLHDWDVKNEKFLLFSEGLNALDREMFNMDLKDFTIDEVTRILPLGADVYRIDGKPYEEKLILKYLRYFLTFLVVSFFLGSAVSILYLVYNNIW